MKRIKNFILRKLGILSLKKKVSALEKENKKLQKRFTEAEKANKNLEKRIVQANKNNDKLSKQIENLEKLVFSQNRGVTVTERKPRIIVSVTSYPARIAAVPIALERLMAQTMRPDKIVLWLSRDQFPGGENDLPDALIDLKKDGLEIKWCDGDMKAYKKVLPALKEYPDDLIVLADDDLIYRSDLIENLYKAHQKHPNAIIAARVHQIVFDEDGRIVPYSNWKKECEFAVGEIKEDWFYTGGAGTLLPPHIFGEEVFNTEVISELCLYADDIWLNIHSAMKHVPIVNIANNSLLDCIAGTQAERLYTINKVQNDAQLKNLLEHYKEQLSGTIYDQSVALKK